MKRSENPLNAADVRSEVLRQEKLTYVRDSAGLPVITVIYRVIDYGALLPVLEVGAAFYSARDKMSKALGREIALGRLRKNPARCDVSRGELTDAEALRHLAIRMAVDADNALTAFIQPAWCGSSSAAFKAVSNTPGFEHLQG